MVIVLDYNLCEFPQDRVSYINMDKVVTVSVDKGGINFVFVGGKVYTLEKNQKGELFESVKRQIKYWSGK